MDGRDDVRIATGIKETARRLAAARVKALAREDVETAELLGYSLKLLKAAVQAFVFIQRVSGDRFGVRVELEAVLRGGDGG